MMDGPFEVESEGGSRSALAIAEDFAALVATFDRHLQQLPASEARTRGHFERARKSAERGVELSRQLVSLRRSG